jgi:hypothetical protein
MFHVLFAIVFTLAFCPLLAIVLLVLAIVGFKPFERDEPTYVVPLGRHQPKINNRKDLVDAIDIYINGNGYGYVHISKWDVSQVYNMREVFYLSIRTKRDNDAIAGIEEWDVSHVQDVTNMFKYCSEFNQPIGKWKLSSVVLIDGMFYGCIRFNQNLDEWSNTIRRVEFNVHPFASSSNYWKHHKWIRPTFDFFSTNK